MCFHLQVGIEVLHEGAITADEDVPRRCSFRSDKALHTAHFISKLVRKVKEISILGGGGIAPLYCSGRYVGVDDEHLKTTTINLNKGR